MDNITTPLKSFLNYMSKLRDLSITVVLYWKIMRQMIKTDPY